VIGDRRLGFVPGRCRRTALAGFPFPAARPRRRARAPGAGSWI